MIFITLYNDKIKIIFKKLVMFLHFISYLNERGRKCVNFEDIYQLYFKDVFLFLRSISAGRRITPTDRHIWNCCQGWEYHQPLRPKRIL